MSGLGIGDWAYWLLAIGVLVVSAGLVYAAWWGLFADRSRGRRRCPRCWYDMAYSPGMTCAECGFTAKHERQFQCTRRRYRIAAAAIIFNVALALFVTERVTQQGFHSYIPTRALIWMLPLVDGPGNNLYDELAQRASLGKLSHGQWLALLEQCGEGDWGASPTSDDWIAKYGNFLANLRPLLTSTPALEEPLTSIPARLDLTTRPVWPRGMPVTVAVQVRDWWPWGTECRIRARPHLAGAAEITFYRSADSRYQRTPFSLHVPPLDESVREIKIDFEIDRRRLPVDGRGEIDWTDEEPSDAAWEPALKQTLIVKTRGDGDPGHLASAARDEAMTRLLKRAFSTGVVRWPLGRSPVRFSVAAPETFVAEFDDTAVGVSVELLCDGEVARRLNMWWLGGAMQNGGAPRFAGRNYGFEVHEENVDLLRQADADDKRWQIRVRSDPQLAFRAGQAKKYWEGEFMIPMKLQMRESAAPPRPWRTVP